MWWPSAVFRLTVVLSLYSLLGSVGPHGLFVCCDPLEGSLPHPCGCWLVKCGQWAQVWTLGWGGLGLLAREIMCCVFFFLFTLFCCLKVYFS